MAAMMINGNIIKSSKSAVYIAAAIIKEILLGKAEYEMSLKHCTACLENVES